MTTLRKNESRKDTQGLEYLHTSSFHQQKTARKKGSTTYSFSTWEYIITIRPYLDLRFVWEKMMRIILGVKNKEEIMKYGHVLFMNC